MTVLAETDAHFVGGKPAIVETSARASIEEGTKLVSAELTLVGHNGGFLFEVETGAVVLGAHDVPQEHVDVRPDEQAVVVSPLSLSSLAHGPGHGEILQGDPQHGPTVGGELDDRLVCFARTHEDDLVRAVGAA